MDTLNIGHGMGSNGAAQRGPAAAQRGSSLVVVSASVWKNTLSLSRAPRFGSRCVTIGHRLR